MLKRVASSVNVFLIALLALTVQADDISLKNPSNKPVQFRVVIQSTGFDKIVTVQPGQTVNPIGTDLWHNVRIAVIGLEPEPAKNCHLIIEEKNVALWGEPDFYLPEVIAVPVHPACPYTSNVPTCGCFSSARNVECCNKCTDITNAQVVIQH